MFRLEQNVQIGYCSQSNHLKTIVWELGNWLPITYRRHIILDGAYKVKLNFCFQKLSYTNNYQCARKYMLFWIL